MSGQTISPSRPRAKEGAPRTRAMTDAHGTVAPFGVRGDWEPWRRRPEGAEDSATPGGYGGKPPGVAIIGVPTGARNAGRCSDGGPEHRFERYYGSPLDAYNPEHLFQVYVLLCVVYVRAALLQNVTRTPDVCAL